MHSHVKNENVGHYTDKVTETKTYLVKVLRNIIRFGIIVSWLEYSFSFSARMDKN